MDQSAFKDIYISILGLLKPESKAEGGGVAMKEAWPGACRKHDIKKPDSYEPTFLVNSITTLSPLFVLVLR